MEAINQLFSTFIWCLQVIGWCGLGLVIYGVAVFFYRLIALSKLSPVGTGVWLWGAKDSNV